MDSIRSLFLKMIKCSNTKLQFFKKKLPFSSQNGIRYSLLESEIQEIEFTKQEISHNPYYNTFDISDLFFQQNYLDYLFMKKDILKILLRHNLLLKNIYRQYANNYDDDDETHFSINLGVFIQIINDSKGFCSNTSPMALNRLFNQGITNHFRLFNDIKESKIKHQLLIEHQQIVSLQDQFILQYLKDEYQMKESINVHNQKTILFYRHFIELLIRFSYMKNNYTTINLNRAIEKFIENNLSKLNQDDLNKMDKHDPARGSQKSHSLKSQNSEQKILAKFQKWNGKIHKIFKQYTKKQSKIFGINDETVLFKDIFLMLVNAEFDDEQIDRFIDLCQKDYAENGEKKGDKGDKKDKAEAKDSKYHNLEKKKKATEEVILTSKKSITGDIDMNKEKLLGCFHHEMVFKQFFETILIFLCKESKSNKIQQIELYVNKAFTTFVEKNICRVNIEDIRIKQYTNKDKQVDDLKEQRIKEKLERERQILREQQIALQKKEVDWMKQEDFDVQSAPSDAGGSDIDSEFAF